MLPRKQGFNVTKETDFLNKICLFQVTHVEPYFSSEDKESRPTYFERNHNVSRFAYEVLIGKPTVAEREIERIVLTVEDGLSFPYIKKRFGHTLTSMISTMFFYSWHSSCFFKVRGRRNS
jgi:hypothetical protein